MKLEIQTRLAHNLKRLRKNRNLTQFELAEKANISEAMVKSIELSLAWPSDKTLSQLSEALDADIINFFLPTNTESFINSSLFSNIKEVVTENYNEYLQSILADIKI
jgi:transcriptional regulator with XRE-family HTH domain